MGLTLRPSVDWSIAFWFNWYYSTTAAATATTVAPTATAITRTAMSINRILNCGTQYL